MYNAVVFARISTTGTRLSLRKSLPSIAARVYKFKSVWRSTKIILPYPAHRQKDRKEKRKQKVYSRVSSRCKRNFNLFYMTHASTFFTIVRILLWPVISLTKHSFRSTAPRSINCLSRTSSSRAKSSPVPNVGLCPCAFWRRLSDATRC